jgi:hypothetical protein
MMPRFSTRLVVRASASLLICREVSHEMFLSPRSLRIPDALAVRMNWILTDSRDSEVSVACALVLPVTISRDQEYFER